jgi:hypothetical protein
VREAKDQGSHRGSLLHDGPLLRLRQGAVHHVIGQAGNALEHIQPKLPPNNRGHG